MTPKLTPFLWLDGRAEEAANHYAEIFRDASIQSVSAAPNGGAMVSMTVCGQPLIAFDGGPAHELNEAFSLFVRCADQAEVDELWQRLGEGGQPGPCGWIKDRFGVWWQIVPDGLGELLGGQDREGARRATQAMLEMSKLDIAALRRAYEGTAP